MIVMSVILASAGELCREFGVRIRAQRISQSMTQQELASRSGLSLGAVRKLESDGHATVLTLMQAVISLGLVAELDQLFALKPQQSIADMARAEAARRKRAPRRKAP